MLETELKKLTAAVEANTAALGGTAPAAAIPPIEGAAEAAAASPLTIDIPAVGAAPVLATDVELPPGTEAQVTVPVADLKAITEAIVELCKAKGREAAAQLMAEYGAQKVPDLKQHADKYPEILAAIKARTVAK